MDIQTPPTPPATQAQHPEQFISKYQCTRHEFFYCQEPTLVDPVILQVEDTLYRLSKHALSKGCYFFASAFSIGSSDPLEGSSDQHPIVLPQTISCVDFDIYLWFGVRYDPNPTQDTLIRAVALSRQWSIHNLYGYALHHFEQQFKEGYIHPAVVLGVSREYGIPSLIEPAVKALARMDIPLASWCTDPEVIRYTSVIDIGVIGRLKEKILMARIALRCPPPVVHDHIMCPPRERIGCEASWKDFWMSMIVPKLLSPSTSDGYELLSIQKSVDEAVVPGMGDECRERTVPGVVGKPGWRAEETITNGAIEVLMVVERGMLTLEDVI